MEFPSHEREMSKGKKSSSSVACVLLYGRCLGVDRGGCKNVLQRTAHHERWLQSETHIHVKGLQECLETAYSKNFQK